MGMNQSITNSLNIKQLISLGSSYDIPSDEIRFRIRQMIKFYKTVPQTLWVYRFLTLDGENDLKFPLGSHWTTSAGNIKDRDFLDNIKSTVNPSKKDRFVVFGEYPSTNINVVESINTNVIFFEEKEVFIQDSSSFKSIYLCEHDNFNEYTPLQSKGVKQLK